MCTVIAERFNAEMNKVGMTGELLDLQFGRGFTRDILGGRSISIDMTKKLAKQLRTSSDYLMGEDLKAGSTANMAPYVEISGERLKSRRESLGWSQLCLSEMCGIKYQTVFSNIETGRAHNIARDTMMCLAYFLKCDIRYLQGKIRDFGEGPANLPEGRSEKQIVSRVQGARVGKLMDDGRMSLTKVSKVIGIPRPLLARLKAGSTVSIPESAALKLAKVLDVEASNIIISTKNSKLVNDDVEEVLAASPEPLILEVPERIAKDPDPVVEEQKPVIEAPKPIEAEVVEVQGADDVKVSLTRLAQITAFAEKHPDVLGLLDQLMELKEEQISQVTGALDLMIKGAIVS